MQLDKDCTVHCLPSIMWLLACNWLPGIVRGPLQGLPTDITLILLIKTLHLFCSAMKYKPTWKLPQCIAHVFFIGFKKQLETEDQYL